MKTLSLKLPADLDARLQKAARQRRVSKSEVARAALESYLAQEKPQPTKGSAYDLARELAGSVDSGMGDLSHNRKHMEGYGR